VSTSVCTRDENIDCLGHFENDLSRDDRNVDICLQFWV
jgi:hypothetical protein